MIGLNQFPCAFIDHLQLGALVRLFFQVDDIQCDDFAVARVCFQQRVPHDVGAGVDAKDDVVGGFVGHGGLFV